VTAPDVAGCSFLRADLSKFSATEDSMFRLLAQKDAMT